MTDKEAKNHIEYSMIKGNYPLPKELGIEALNMAVDAIKFKQKAGVVISQLRADRDRLATALDEIRAEIDRQQKWLLHAGYTAYNVDIALDAIKSVAVESEDKE